MNITPLFPDKPPAPPAPPGHLLLELISEAAALTLQARHRGRSSDEAASGIAVTLMETIRAHGGATVPQLARSGSTSRQNIQVQVNRLLGLGCVQLSSNPAHRRSQLVSLTAMGNRLLDEYHTAQETQYENLAGELTEAEITTTIEVLRKLRVGMSAVVQARRTEQKPAPPTPRPTGVPGDPGSPLTVL
jgi:DNA-binding MarR family transcriptional regulator